MTRSLYIDPGVAGKGCAVAVFQGQALVSLAFAKADASAGIPVPAPLVVVEQPEYQGERTADARPKDLMDLSFAAGLLAGRLMAPGGRLLTVTPSGWKATERKPQMHARIWAVLTAAERYTVAHALGLASAGPVGEAIAGAVERGALDRWRRPGGAYYRAAEKSWTDALDAAAMGAIHSRRAPGFGTHPEFQSVGPRR